jgi:nucleoside-diphosphate-sugar epimerase
MGSVAIIGATGAVGREIGRILSAQGTPYVAIGRTPSTLKALFGADPHATCRAWDTQSAQSLVAALEGVESVVYAIGVEYWKFELHPILVQRALDAARAAGVKRFLLVGTVYPYGRSQTPEVSESHPREPHTFKGRMRKEQEDRVLAAHVPGTFETVVLRLPDLYGPGMEKSFMTDAFKHAPQGKAATLIAPIDVPHEYAFIPDCAQVAVRLLNEPRAYGSSWNYAGPGTIAPREFAAAIYAQCGTKPRYTLVNRTLLRLLGLFNPMLRELVEMHYLVTDPVVMDDRRLRALLGDLPKTPYAQGIRLTLARDVAKERPRAR